jgi:hypothetical protein
LLKESHNDENENQDENDLREMVTNSPWTAWRNLGFLMNSEKLFPATPRTEAAAAPKSALRLIGSVPLPEKILDKYTIANEILALNWHLSF